LQRGDRLRWQPPRHAAHQAARFRRRQSQLRPFDLGDRPARAQACERRRRNRSAGHDDPAARRQLHHRLADDLVERGIRRDLVVVVQREDERPSKAVVERAEEGAREDGRRARMGPEWLGTAAPAITRQITEEGRDVGVAGVEPVPEAADPTRGQVTGHQRGLPRPGLTPHPREWLPDVEPSEQSWPQDEAAHARANALADHPVRDGRHGDDTLAERRAPRQVPREAGRPTGPPFTVFRSPPHLA